MLDSNRISLAGRAEFARLYVQRLQLLLSSLDADAIAKFISRLMEARERGAQIFFLGNGGSASTASHFANDLSIGTRSVEKPFRVMSLCDNSSIVTAIANDYGYEHVFQKQLEIWLRPGDIVVAISASGNSVNLLKAVDFARSVRAFTVGLTGFDGGKLRQMVDLSLHVSSDLGEYGPVEDVHLVLDHLIGNCLSAEIRNERGDARIQPRDLSDPNRSEAQAPVLPHNGNS